MNTFSVKTLLWFLAILLIFEACHKRKKFENQSEQETVPVEENQPAAADAVTRLSVRLPELLRTNKETIVYPQTTGAVSFEWAQVSGPGFVSFQNSLAQNTAVHADKDGIYILSLTVKNEQGASLTREMTLHWDTSAPLISLSDEIRAFQAFALDAKVSSDAVKFEWTKILGPGDVYFDSINTASTRISANADGSYIIRLTVWDDLGNASFKQLNLIWDSIAPTVSVGQDRYTNQSITLDAMSMDAINFAWTKISGPGTIEFSAPSAEDTGVKASRDGTYVLRLTITKSNGATAYDELQLVWDTEAPKVSVGLDQTSRYRANIDAVTDGGLNYQWSQLSGPGLVSFSSAKSEDTSVVASQAGNYELQLLVTDQAGNSASDRLLVSFANELKVYAKHLSAGGSQTCSVLDDDSLSCWGYNFEGELGYGDSKDRYRTASFGINLGPHKTALHVATAYDHSCAILNDHSVKCWGQNAYGQLGYGDTTNRMAPPAQSINLGDNRTATAIFTGFSHSCAILDDDSVKCWGANGSGQLGLGDYVNRMAPPMQAIKLGPNRYARSLSLGAYHSCALLDDYSVKCWGNNSEAQLGYTDKVQRASPAINPLFFGGAQKVLSLVSGDYHSCAILDDMSLRCWGRNTDGQLGLGDTAPHLALAESKLSFAEGLHPQSLTAGLSHTCVLFDDGSVQCWGQNDEGQLGYGDTEQRYAPSASPLLMGEGRLAIALTAGRKHTCALLDDKTLKCWGSNSYGQLGNGQVSNLPAVPIKALEYENRPSI